MINVTYARLDYKRQHYLSQILVQNFRKLEFGDCTGVPYQINSWPIFKVTFSSLSYITQDNISFWSVCDFSSFGGSPQSIILFQYFFLYLEALKILQESFKSHPSRNNHSRRTICRMKSVSIFQGTKCWRCNIRAWKVKNEITLFTCHCISEDTEG